MSDWRDRLVQYPDRPAWLEGRRKGIGGSDVPTIMGLTPRSPFALWQRKLQLVESTEADIPPWLMWGHLLEKPVADRFTELTGLPVTLHNDAIVRHASRAWCQYSLDGDVRATALYEGKSTAVTRAAEWDDGVPAAVYAQVQHGMDVCDLEVCYVACFAGTHRDIIWTEVLRDRVWYANECLPKLDKFWCCVEAEEPPEPTHPADADAIESMYPRAAKGTEVEMPAFFDELQDKWLEACDRIREAEVEKKVIRAWVTRELKEADTGTLLSGRAWTWKQQSRKESVIPAGTTRVLRVRKAKKR